MKLSFINPDTLYDPVANGYSHAITAIGGASLVFIAGQGGDDASGALPADFEEQVKQAFANLKEALAAAGAQPYQVAKLTTYVVDHDETRLGLLTRQLTDMFGEWLPAQTLVPVPRLALDGMLFEVDAVAVLG